MIKKIIFQTGFEKVGISPAQQPEESRFLEQWLRRQFHGDMHWMETRKQKRMDIGSFFPGAKSVITVVQNYYVPDQNPTKSSDLKISRYAWGEDYHRIMKKKLKRALTTIREIEPGLKGRISVDTAPIMEKLWAVRAGVGWQGKHTNLITRDFGSWVFLGEIVVDIDLVYDQPIEDFCGTCTACIDACPTGAIVEPYVLDARKCISYLTIEYWDKPIPGEQRKNLDGWIFGCDICQQVCPWNKFCQPANEKRFYPAESNSNIDPKDLMTMRESEYKRKFKKSPVLRPGWKNFIRNIKSASKPG